MHKRFLNQRRRNAKLKELGFASYGDYLKSERWQRRRTAYAESHPAVCRHCDRPADDLHHVTYERVGQELDEDLAWLCRTHHGELHEYGAIRPPTEPQVKALTNFGVSAAAIGRLTRGTAYLLIGDLFNSRILVRDVNAAVAAAQQPPSPN
jgi:hypothetical protein